MGFGAVPLLSASPGPLLSVGLEPILGEVSFVPLLLPTGLWSILGPPEPVRPGVGLRSSGYGARWGAGRENE